jgi:hypothetical protein
MVAMLVIAVSDNSSGRCANEASESAQKVVEVLVASSVIVKLLRMSMRELLTNCLDE